MDPRQYLEQLRSRARRKPEPVPVAGLLTALRKSRKRVAPARIERFRTAWQAVALRLLGPAAAAATEVTGQAAGELRVSVTSHPLAQELQLYRSNELVTELNKELGKKDNLARIRFKAGRASSRRSAQK